MRFRVRTNKMKGTNIAIEKISMEQLRELYDIAVKYGNSRCEYEVSEGAMKIYKEYYSYYKNWNYIRFDDSIQAFFRCKGEIGKYKRENGEYNGSFLLVNKEEDIDKKLIVTKVLTADILTSIKYPISYILEHAYKDGQDIKKYILKESNFEYKGDFNEESLPYIKAFAEVYYWCGNMMPVICNSRGGNDTWHNKIDDMLKNSESDDYYSKFCKSELGRGYSCKELYPSWIYAFYKDKKDNEARLKQFISDNFLIDFCENKNGKVSVKKFTALPDRKNDKKAIEEWFIENTKLIIQRSYRIVNDYNEKWNDNTFSPVKEIMKYVFRTAGMDCLKSEEYSKTWF